MVHEMTEKLTEIRSDECPEEHTGFFTFKEKGTVSTGAARLAFPTPFCLAFHVIAGGFFPNPAASSVTKRPQPFFDIVASSFAATKCCTRNISSVMDRGPWYDSMDMHSVYICI